MSESLLSKLKGSAELVSPIGHDILVELIADMQMLVHELEHAATCARRWESTLHDLCVGKLFMFVQIMLLLMIYGGFLLCGKLS